MPIYSEEVWEYSTVDDYFPLLANDFSSYSLTLIFIHLLREPQDVL
jgi:hypothetical protein